MAASALAQYPQTSTVNYVYQYKSYDVAALDRYLKTRNVDMIVRNFTFFSSAYVKAYAELQDAQNKERFCVLKTAPGYYSSCGPLTEKIMTILEQIQQILDKSLSQGEHGIFKIKEIKGQVYVLDGERYNESTGVDRNIFDTFVKPVLPQLASYCEAAYSEEFQDGDMDVKEPVVFFDWHRNYHNFFLIRPVNISDPTFTTLWQQYQKGEYCDCSLYSRDLYLFKIHTCLFVARGGDKIDKWLQVSRLNSGVNKITINLPQITTSKYVEFLYKGELAFRYKSNEGGTFLSFDQIVELFRFAEKEVKSELLSDCCLNEMNFIATEGDVGTLNQLYKEFSEPFFEKLAHYFSSDDMDTEGSSADEN